MLLDDAPDPLQVAVPAGADEREEGTGGDAQRIAQGDADSPVTEIERQGATGAFPGCAARGVPLHRL